MCQLYFNYCCCLIEKLLTKIFEVYFYCIIYCMIFTLNWRKEKAFYDKAISLSETVTCCCISSANHMNMNIAPITQQKMQKQRSTNK